MFSAFLLHGLTVKRTLYMIGWMFTVAIFTFPEAGLVLFMSLHYWQVESLNGLTELVYWSCRVLCNIGGMVCVQSLYSTWKEEKLVMRRLQDLNMSSIITEGVRGSTNGHMKNIGAPGAYQNTAYINSNNRLSVLTTCSTPTLPKLSRCGSSTSQLRGSLFGGSLPLNNGYPQHLPPMNNLQYAFLGAAVDTSNGGSEFNASKFDGMLAVSVGGNGSAPSRTQSLLDLRSIAEVCSPPPMSAEQLVQATQSLDRRMTARRPRRAGSVDHLDRYDERVNVYRLRDGRVLVPDYEAYRRARFSDGSKRSLAESDDLQKYRDVAL